MPFSIFSKWVGIAVSVVTLASAVCAAVHVEAVMSEDIANMGSRTPPHAANRGVSSESDSLDESGGMIIVSTMDGKVSAIDGKKGMLMWTVDASMGPLVSSSITKLQINQDGKIIRLIPSLSGGLFKFDGNSIEALPFSADQLLSSSFKISDGSILIGDNEVTTFGIDAMDGRMAYYCTAEGCEPLSNASPDSHIIVIKRHQKTVRSVDVRNGQEKWNFSVGEINLDISEGASGNIVTIPKPAETIDSHGDVHGFDASSSSLASKDENDDVVDENGSGDGTTMYKKFKIKVSVPDGTVSMYSSEFKHEWKYKFSSAIANAWQVHGAQFRKVNLFDPNTVPALRDENKNTMKDDPTMYLGFYQNHAYIQVSGGLKHTDQKSLSVIDHLCRGRAAMHATKFSFHPYMAISSRLTEAVIGEAKEGDIAIYGSANTKGSCNDKWGVYIDSSKEKISEIGYYLITNTPYFSLLQPTERKGKGTEIDAGDGFFITFPISGIYPSLFYWWKEVLFISIVSSVLLHIVVTKVMKNSMRNTPAAEVPMETQPPADPIHLTTPPLLPMNPPRQFQSRFFQDFEPVRCLGKGGFGIVLESQHKVDARTYAIKRIRLPNKKAARDKVLREVRALAKLSHQCIVRYFNAWIEEPPSGWQEKVDQDIIKEVCPFPSTMCITSLPLSSGAELPGRTSEAITPGNRMQHIQSTGTFSEETHPFSFGSGSDQIGAEDDWNSEDLSNAASPRANYAFSPSFDESSALDDDKNIPFGRYTREDSLSIVFEKTGFQPSTDSAFEEDGFDLHQGHDNLFRSSPGSSLKRRQPSKKSSTYGKKSSSSHKSDPRDGMLQATDVDVYLYIQMELCQRESLRTWLTNNYDRKDCFCLTIFQQVLSAVEYIHKCNLIHRDLKPSNIFFSSDGQIKVGDFGLVTAIDDLCNRDFDGSETNTDTFTSEACSHTEKVGTRLYMAPEQMSGRLYSQKVDIFALGLILIELFTPFSTQMERIDTLKKSRAGEISQTFETAYSNEANLARRMLSEKPSLRPTASEAMKDEIFSSNPDQSSTTV